MSLAKELNRNKGDALELPADYLKTRKQYFNLFRVADDYLRAGGLFKGGVRAGVFCNIAFLYLLEKENDLELMPRLVCENFPLHKNDGETLYEKINGKYASLLRDHYGQDVLYKMDFAGAQALSSLVYLLEKYKIDANNRDILSAANEFWLQGKYNDMGEFYTPEFVTKAMVPLLAPKMGESVYDPFCGSGNMLVEAVEYAKKQGGYSVEVHGNELTVNVKLARMSLILAGHNQISNLIRRDSLGNPCQQKHDIVITNIPFSFGTYEEYKDLYYLGSDNSDYLCVEHCFNAINTDNHDARMGIIAPAGFVELGKYKALMDFIHEHSDVQEIPLPRETFQPYTTISTSALILTNIRKPVKMAKAG